VRKRKPGDLRVALFPDSYAEIDGVATVSRNLEAFAKKRDLQFLTIHAGPCEQIMNSGSVTKVQLPRGRFTFPLDRAHRCDLAFWRHYHQVLRMVQDFAPDVIQITGPSDVGMLGALIAHKLSVPLAAFWETNLHQYGRCRLSAALSRFPSFLTTKFLNKTEAWILRAAMRYYRIPQLLFAPNHEMVALLRRLTGKSCFLMPHGVDNQTFNPKFRTSEGAPFTIGYVGRLTAEKNVRLLAQIEKALFSHGHRDFRIVVVGEGPETTWLQKNMRNALFTGVLSGPDLSQAFANMDLFVFPSNRHLWACRIRSPCLGRPGHSQFCGGTKKYNSTWRDRVCR
jgi:phosphatidylinositol alpha 1,6-mannosyltransferase